MPDRGAPYPYHFSIDGKGYLHPPDIYRRAVGAPWWDRDSLPWFPERRPSDTSEAALPPKSELTITIRDRSGGSGWSDPPGSPGDPVNVYGMVQAQAVGTPGGWDCSVQDVAFPGPQWFSATMPAGYPLANDDAYTFELGTNFYLVVGTKMYRTDKTVANNTTALTWTAVQANLADLPSACTSRPVVFRGAQAVDLVYFPLGDATAFRVWDGNTANAFGVATNPSVNGYAENNRVISFAVRGGELWALGLDATAATRAYRVNKCTDGTPLAGGDPNWFASYIVSDTIEVARYLLVAHNRIYIGTDRYLKSLADDDPNNALVQTVSQFTSATTNFKTWADWNNELWFVVADGVFAVTLSGGQLVVNQVGPELLPANRTRTGGGRVFGLSPHGGIMYCSYYFDVPNVTQRTIVYKYRRYDNGSRWAYHPITELLFSVNEDGGRLLFVLPNCTITGQTDKRSFLVYPRRAAAAAFHCVLPLNVVYPPGDDQCRYQRGVLYDTRLTGHFTWVTKLLKAVTIRASRLSAARGIELRYVADGNDFYNDSSGTVISSVTADPGGRASLTTPVSLAWWQGTMVSTTDNVTPQIVRATTYSYILRPPAKGFLTVYAWVADYIPQRGSGQRDKRSAANIQTDLIALDSSTSLVTIIDELGRSYSTTIDEVKIFDVFDDASGRVEKIARITASEY